MSSYAQIPQDLPEDLPDPHHSHEDASRASSRRIYWLTAVVCCGGLLFGYDSGVIGGVLTFDSFRRDFRYTPNERTTVSAIAVGIQQAGALAGCLLIWPVTNAWGRRRAAMLSSVIFCVGVLFEIVNSHALLVFYFGRIICGLGVGASATLTPIYLAEMSPKHLRARLGSGYQFSYTIGIFLSYWIDYGMQFRPPTPAQWQIPLALQLVPGALMGLGMLSLPESVRWLLAHGATRAAWESLVWTRSSSSSSVALEFAEMKHALNTESSLTADFHPRELLLHPPYRRRIVLAITIFLAQQSTGATAMAYFGPQFFALLVGDNNQSLTLLLTGIFGALKVLACLFFILVVADRFGRKPLLSLGALAMALCMVITSILLANPSSTASTSNPSSSSTTTSIPPKSIATILLIYTTITSYNLSWGPLPWPLSAELFPTRIREPGVAIAVASQWTFNFVWSFATPYLLDGLGWATFLLFGCFDALIVGFIVGWLPETRGRSLEEIEGLFDRGWRKDGDRGGFRDGEDEGEGLVRHFEDRDSEEVDDRCP